MLTLGTFQHLIYDSWRFNKFNQTSTFKLIAFFSSKMVVGEPNINNIMGGIENTGTVRLHNHRKKLKQR